ncbi:MAG TPA: hypothetical protein VKV28_04850 [Candidatus Binataceae bacterium]|nr:hypothetical protein [Candidatus Binataceae bacterium]
MKEEKPSKRHQRRGDTEQATDRESGAWDIPYARARFEPGVETESVGNPYADDPMGERRERDRK